MGTSLTRRSFFAACSLAAVPSIAKASAPPDVPSSFPTQNPDLVREMVGVAHGNIARVKELVGRQPTLAKASWDWAFGDWESALGAASHVGNREIAEFLIANGARPSIFSAAMLGQLDVVKAFVAASPGIQRTKGPHSITLLSHAKAGGPRAQAVADYLATIEGADERPTEQPLSPQDVGALAGAYGYGDAADERIDITAAKDRVPTAPGMGGVMSFQRPGRVARGLVHLGRFEFVPVGAERVRIRFATTAGVMTMTVHDPDVVLTARKL